MEINFRHEINGQKVITAIAQDWKTGQILMVANMNKDALQKTIETGKAHYWSTSRNSQWLKGESSGHTQEVKEILVDCDMDAVVLKVKQNGAAFTTLLAEVLMCVYQYFYVRKVLRIKVSFLLERCFLKIHS